MSPAIRFDELMMRFTRASGAPFTAVDQLTLDIAARRHDRVGTCSGGMQRRLALARALLTRPAVIVLDEPTLGVDVQSRAAIWERVRALATAGNTVLLTTNYMEEAQVTPIITPGLTACGILAFA